jgi:CRP/FNR family transcriptional regulator, cyclic AMP receptor protein
VLFTTAFAGQGVDASMLVPWEARAVEVGAKRLAPAKGSKLLQALWAKDKYMALLDANAVQRMERFFEFATVPTNRDIIRQDEYGNYMIILLAGTIAVDRVQPWGEHLRLAETRPGDILGEMSLLDSGIRFSACTSLTECDIAVLSAEAMDEMMTSDPQLAASLVALLARKLSLRLRVVSARLSDNQK